MTISLWPLAGVLLVSGGATVFASSHARSGETRVSRSDDANPLEVEQQQQARDIIQLKAQMAAMQNQLARLSTPLAFTGEGGNGHSYSNGATVHFDRVLANVGGMYDTLSGIVTVPQDGVYLIYVRSDPPGGSSDSLRLDLRVNNVHQVYAYGERGTVGGATVALNLHAGDRIHVIKDAGSSSLGYAALLSVVRI